MRSKTLSSPITRSLKRAELMKFVEAIASAVVLVLLLCALSEPVGQIIRLKKATSEIRKELYIMKERYVQE